MKRHMKYGKFELGQSLVMMVFALILMIMLTALVMDGGHAFVQRRVVQNSADNSALAGVFYLLHTISKNEIDLLDEIHYVAEGNGIINGNTDVDAFYTNLDGELLSGCNVVGTCGGVPSSARGIKTITRMRTDTFFATVFGIQYTSVSANAVAVIRYGGFLSQVDDVMVALGECPEKTIDGSGSNSEIIGGVRSNGDLYFSGSGNHIHGSSVTVNGATDDSTKIKYDSTPVTGSKTSDPFASLKLEDFLSGPLVSGKTVYNLSSGGKVDIGRLKSLGLYNDKTGELKQGVYYAGNNAIELGDSKMWGTVTLVSNNHIKISGSEINGLNAYVDGMLMFTTYQVADACSDWAIDIGGSGASEPKVNHNPDGTVESWTYSNNFFRGLIYAPHGQVMLSGSKTSVLGAIVSETVKLNGSNLLIVKGESDDTIPQIELID